jgi:hypothetical protein
MDCGIQLESKHARFKKINEAESCLPTSLRVYAIDE